MPERSEFAKFLRSRRERVSPEDVGLPPGGRRRTPGLRREEVAALAGISVDYLVRLEQGRETNPSMSVLAALGRTLRLSSDEALHLKALSVDASCGSQCPAASVDSRIDETTQALLDQLDRSPAFVLGHQTDLLAWNMAYERLMAGTGVLEGSPPNLLQFTFLDPRARTFYRDWDAIAREQVGNLRTVTGRLRDDGSAAALVGTLSVSSGEFARLWAEHDVGEKRVGLKELVHPVVGELRLRFTTLQVPDENGLRLVAYLPATAADEVTLGRLLDPEPARLRVVSG